jgi:bacteriocin-like protein
MTIRSESLAIRRLTKNELEAVSGGSGTSETVSGKGSGTVSGTAAGPAGETHTGGGCPNLKV